MTIPDSVLNVIWCSLHNDFKPSRSLVLDTIKLSYFNPDVPAHILINFKISFDFPSKMPYAHSWFLTMRQVILSHFCFILVIFWIRKWANWSAACFRMHLNPSSFELVYDEKIVHVGSKDFQNIITLSKIVQFISRWPHFIDRRAQWRSKSISRCFHTYK